MKCYMTSCSSGSNSSCGSSSSGSLVSLRRSGVRSGSRSGSGISSGRAGRPGDGASLPGGVCSGGSNSGTVLGAVPALAAH